MPKSGLNENILQVCLYIFCYPFHINSARSEICRNLDVPIRNHYIDKETFFARWDTIVEDSFSACDSIRTFKLITLITSYSHWFTIRYVAGYANFTMVDC